MQIIPRNEIPGNSALLKVTSTEKYVYQVNKKVPFQKLIPHLPRNSDIFIIRGIFRTLENSKVRRYLDAS